jgi:hypothetical protein
MCSSHARLDRAGGVFDRNLSAAATVTWFICRTARIGETFILAGQASPGCAALHLTGSVLSLFARPSMLFRAASAPHP